MCGMTADDIIASLRRDAEANTARERRATETRHSLDMVTTSILTAKIYLHASMDDEAAARTLLWDKEQGTAEIRARLAALETRQTKLLFDLSPSAAPAARQPPPSVAPVARKPLPPVGCAARQPFAPVAPAARQPSPPAASAARQPPTPADFPALAAPAAQQPPRQHTDTDADGDSSSSWSTVARRSRRDTRRTPPHDAYLDVRISKLRHRNHSFTEGRRICEKASSVRSSFQRLN